MTSGQLETLRRESWMAGPPERAIYVAYRSAFRRDEDIELALEAASYGGARALGLER